MLKIRVISGAMLTAVLCLIIYFSYIPVVVKATSAVLCILAIRELFKAGKLTKRKELYAVAVIAALVVSCVHIQHYDFLLLVISVEIIVFAGYLLKSTDRRELPLWEILNMTLFVIMSFGTMQYLRDLEHGALLLVLSILVCFITDISAYFVGKHFGKRPLAPKISPNKTIVGSVGGILATVIIFVAAGVYCEYAGLISIDFKLYGIYIAAASVIGQIGDLTMSSIKRVAMIKDYGKLIPGHGGILDRFDSLLFVMSFTYLYYQLGGVFFI